MNLDLVNWVVDYDGCYWGVIERVARPVTDNERATELYTAENLNAPFDVRRFLVEELHQAMRDGSAQIVGWRGSVGSAIPFVLPSHPPYPSS